MSVTNTTADMIFSDVEALSDATETNNGSSLSTNSLFKAKTSQSDYGTLELNQFVLDGSKSIMPVSPTDIAYWSSAKSKADCTFDTDPVFTVTFTGTHSSAGITLTFADEYPQEIKITWYSLAGEQLKVKTFYPDSLIYYCRQQVQYYGKIVIDFVKTRTPYAYIKLQYILYGVELTWSNEMVKTAKVVEEIDTTGATISINTAEIELVDENNTFDIGNEDGEWKSVEKKQPITITETKDGVKIPCGKFYMDKWSFSKNIAKFSLKDAVGLMDTYTFYGGDIYTNTKAGVILDAIFKACGLTTYSIDTEVYNTTVSGWLSIQTCRAAMQRVLFAIGAVADDSRSDTIKIYKPDRYVKSTIPTSRKFYGNTALTMDTYVSGISITYNQYELQTTTSQIFSGTMPKGDTKITFTSPYLSSSITVSAGTIKEVSTNYIVVTMTSSGSCVISGQQYKENSFTYLKNVDHIDSGEVENVKKYSGATLCNTSILPEITEELLNYFTLRKKLSMKYLLDIEQVGNWVTVMDTASNYSTTLIEKQTLDLTGGFIATATCRGYSAVVTANYFTGTELYSGDDVLI